MAINLINKELAVGASEKLAEVKQPDSMISGRRKLKRKLKKKKKFFRRLRKLRR